MVESAIDGVAPISPAERCGQFDYPPRLRRRREVIAGMFGSMLVTAHMAACSAGSVAPEPEEQNYSSELASSASDTGESRSTIDSNSAQGSSPESTSGLATIVSPLASDSSEASSASSVLLSFASVDSTSSASSSIAVDAGWSATPNTNTTFGASNGETVDGGVAESVASSGSGFDAGPQPWTGPPIVSRAGYIDIEPISYGRHGQSRSSASARLFYSFRPADEDPHLAPTFVFFNGGPGYGTSFGLLPRGTGPMTIGSPNDDTALVTNQWSWTQMGNLLYIDTRQAGLSYSTLEDPSNQAARQAENTDTNFNDYLDSADLVRVMLRVLASTPGIQDNPVVMVGESYGGVRATMMLEFLLDYENLRINSWYADPTLADEIAAHYAAVGGNYADPRDQFPAQVLIQPFIAGTQFADQAAIMCLPGSKEERIAQEVGVPCELLDNYRDPYNIDEAWSWSLDLDVVTGQHLSTVSSLEALLGVEPTEIVGLGATQRVGAFRLEGADWTEPQPGFTDVLGTLQPWDEYLVAFNEANFNSDVYDNPYPCVYFARVVARVATFVTDADADIVVDTPAMPATMMKCQQLLTNPFVDGIELSHEPEGQSARPGHWTITYNEDSVEGAGERKVRWPTYVAGHMVAVNQAQQLFEDVRDFLRENAVIP